MRQLAHAREDQARIEQTMKDHGQRHEHDPRDQRTPNPVDDPHSARQLRDLQTLRDHHDHPQRQAAEIEGDSISREPVALPDPVDRLRGPLGPQRAQALAERVQEHATIVEQRTDAELVQEHQQAAPALAALDGAAAYEARRLGHAADQAAERERAAAARARELQARAEQLGRRQRQQHDQLLAEACVQQQAAAHAGRELADAHGREQQLRDQARHPDDWLAQHGPQAAAALAAERELTVRRERSIQAAADRAVEQPGPHIRQAIGERPQAGEQRQRWDQLAHELEQHRLRYQVDVEKDGTAGPRDAPDPQHGAYQRQRDELSRRIQHLRAERGLEAARETDAPGTGLDP